MKGEFSLVIEGRREYEERLHIDAQHSSYSFDTIKDCILQLQKQGVDRSIIQSAFSSSLHVVIIMFLSYSFPIMKSKRSYITNTNNIIIL